MRKVNGEYILSNTDKKRIAAHCRAMARSHRYNGFIKAYLDTRDGEIIYEEFVGDGWIESDYLEFVDCAECHDAAWWNG